MSKLKYRLLTIVALLVTSGFFLFPGEVTVKRRGGEGVLRDTVERRVPLKRGLDLQGGMYLVLEIDDTKQVPANETEARAVTLQAVRAPRDETALSEPAVER